MAYELILSGRVQGVFCRNYCSQYGRKYKIRGAASNLRDGTVQVLIDCDEETVKKYVRALIQNPDNIRFFGSINGIKTNDYSGGIQGDYVF